jgi:hypothetical protein
MPKVFNAGGQKKRIPHSRGGLSYSYYEENNLGLNNGIEYDYPYPARLLSGLGMCLDAEFGLAHNLLL